MAVLPTDLLPSYSFSGTALTIDLSDLPGLTDAEANATSGDGRKVVFELVKALAGTISAANPAIPGVSASIGTPAAISVSKVRKQYAISFDLDISAADVAPLA
jgi:hypothetical protein